MESHLWKYPGVPRVSRRAGPIGLAFTAYEAWGRLSPRQRRLILSRAKRYGPLIAAQALRSARTAAASIKKR